MTLGGVLAGGTGGGCGAGSAPTDWIDARAAWVQCTSAGRDRMPPVLLDLPLPVPPTGLYARRLDAMALNDLGYQRDTVACGALVAPEPAESGRHEASLDALMGARAEAGRAAVRAGGPCACDVASDLGYRGLLRGCVGKATRSDCDVEEGREGVAAALQTVLDAIGDVSAPLLHWRLAGRTDRPGWFGDHRASLLERHPGGSTVYVRGEAVPLRDNAELLRGLLDEPHVVAVARQDSGQALLVVREIGRLLVLDHFAHPAVGAKQLPLLAYVDNASVERYRQLMRKPAAARKLQMDPGAGNLVELDFGLLEHVDQVVDAAAPLADGGRRREGGAPGGPPRLVRALTLQAPFGREGKVLKVDAALTAEGSQWATLLTTEALSPTLDGLGVPEVEPLPAGSGESPYVLRGTDLERLVAHGLERVPGLMREVERRYPGSIRGTGRSWSFSMPPSDMAALLGPKPRFEGLRGRFAAEPYVANVEVDDASRRLRAHVGPK